MPKLTLMNTDYATLWYDDEANLMHHAFHRFIYGEQFRAVLMKGLEYFQQHDIDRWLSDDRKNSLIPQADLDWSLEHWVPEMLRAGWKYWAIVLPDKAVGKQNMVRISEIFATLGLTIEVFSDPEEAYQWLQTVGRPIEQS